MSALMSVIGIGRPCCPAGRPSAAVQILRFKPHRLGQFGVKSWLLLVAPHWLSFDILELQAPRLVQYRGALADAADVPRQATCWQSARSSRRASPSVGGLVFLTEVPSAGLTCGSQRVVSTSVSANSMKSATRPAYLQQTELKSAPLRPEPALRCQNFSRSFRDLTGGPASREAFSVARHSAPCPTCTPPELLVEGARRCASSRVHAPRSFSIRFCTHLVFRLRRIRFVVRSSDVSLSSVTAK